MQGSIWTVGLRCQAQPLAPLWNAPCHQINRTTPEHCDVFQRTAPPVGRCHGPWLGVHAQSPGASAHIPTWAGQEQATFWGADEQQGDRYGFTLRNIRLHYTYTTHTHSSIGHLSTKVSEGRTDSLTLSLLPFPRSVSLHWPFSAKNIGLCHQMYFSCSAWFAIKEHNCVVGVCGRLIPIWKQFTGLLRVCGSLRVHGSLGVH